MGEVDIAKRARSVLVNSILLLGDRRLQVEHISQLLIDLMDVTEQTDVEAAVIAAHDAFKATLPDELRQACKETRCQS